MNIEKREAPNQYQLAKALYLSIPSDPESETSLYKDLTLSLCTELIDQKQLPTEERELFMTLRAIIRYIDQHLNQYNCVDFLNTALINSPFSKYIKPDYPLILEKIINNQTIFSGARARKNIYQNRPNPNDPLTAVFINSPASFYGFTDCPEKDPEQDLPSMGIGYIASAAYQTDSNIGVIDAELKALNPIEIAEAVRQSGAKIVGINCITVSLEQAYAIASLIQQVKTDVQIVFGGIHATLASQDLLKKFPQAWVVHGEGEKTIQGILNGENPFDIPNLTFLAHILTDAAVDNDFRQYMAISTHRNRLNLSKDEDDIPLKHELFGGIYQNSEGKLEASVCTSRGCYGKCVFCASNAVMNLDENNPEKKEGKVRFRNIERVILEIVNLYQKGVRSIRIMDDLFITSAKRLEEFVSAIKTAGLYELKGENRIDFKVMARVDILSHKNITVELLQELKACGVDRIAFGIESGNEDILSAIGKKLTKKDYKPQVLEALGKCQMAGIKAKGFFMLGFPQETEEQMLETVSFAKELMDKKLLQGSVCHLVKAYPGTKLYEEVPAEIREAANQYVDAESIGLPHTDRNNLVPVASINQRGISVREIIKRCTEINQYTPSSSPGQFRELPETTTAPNEESNAG